MNTNISKTETTWATYEAAATQYLERTRDRARVRPFVTEFSAYLRRGSLILDVGCGPGFDAAELRQRGHRVIGLDQAHAMLRLGREQHPGTYVRGDMRNLPFEARFDAVWANASMLHLDRHEFSTTLTGFHRVLQPRGFVALSVKEGSGGGWDTRYGSKFPRWFEYWSEADIDSILKSHGFEVVIALEAAPGPLVWIRRLCRMMS